MTTIIPFTPQAPTVAMVSGVAPLLNITKLSMLIRTVKDRESHLPGIGSFTGPSGFGKSFACAHAAGEFKAYYVEARDHWTKKAMMLAILRQMGIVPAATVSAMVDQAAEELSKSQRPLMLDDFDNVVARRLVETVRDLYEQSRGTIILVGEERLPQKLMAIERFHSRVLAWEQAEPCGLGDAQTLARLHCRHVRVSDDLLDRVVREAQGSCRRVCVNLSRIGDFARDEGLSAISAAEWGQRPLYTGRPPATRSF